MKLFSYNSVMVLIYSIIFFFYSSVALSGDLWVDNDYSGIGTGTNSSPYRTIKEAVNEAIPGTTIHILPGVYREVVVPVNSGTKDYPIKIIAENGQGTVTISGADKIEGDWDYHEGIGYSIVIPSLTWDRMSGRNQIFFNNEMMIWARWPNIGNLGISYPGRENTYTLNMSAYDLVNEKFTLKLTDTNLPVKAKKLVGSIVRMTVGKEWLTADAVIASDDGNYTFNFDLFNLSNTASYAPIEGNYYYIVGSKRLLDDNNEWFIDGSGSTRKLFLGVDEKPNSDDVVEFKVRENALDLSGKKHIEIEDINIFAAGIRTDDDSENISITGMKARYVSHFERKSNVYGVDEHEYGITLRGDGHSLQNSLIQYSAGNGITLKGKRHKILNNTILDTNYSGTKTAGIYVLQAPTNATSDIEIAYNTMQRSGRNQIHFRVMTNSSIHHNDISGAMLQTTDGGAIYTFGFENGGTVIAYNKIHDIFPHGDSTNYDPDGTGKYGNPKIDHNQYGVGVYLDGNTNSVSRHVIVHHNVVWNAMMAMQLSGSKSDKGWGGHQLFNNTFIGKWAGITGPKVAGGTDQVEMINNIIIGKFRPGDGNGGYNGNENPYPETNYIERDFNKLNDIGFVDWEAGDFRLLITSDAKGTGVLHHPYLHDGYQTPGAVNLFRDFSRPMFLAGVNASEFKDARTYSISLSEQGTQIDADWFDTLGGGISFVDDTPGNNAVENLQPTHRPNEWMDSTNSKLAWLRAGELVNYSIRFSAEGTYKLRIKAMSDNLDINLLFRTLKFYSNPFIQFGAISSSNKIQSTDDDGWSEYEFDFTVASKQMGHQIMQLKFNNNTALDWIRIIKVDTPQ